MQIRPYILIAGAFLFLVAIAPRSAGAMELDSPGSTQDFRDAATAAAVAFPEAVLACPLIHLTFSEDEPVPPGLTSWGAWANRAGCRINFRRGYQGRPFREVCPMMVHEFGHLAGITFPDNPQDPVHSPDPDSIMYSQPQVWPSECGVSDGELASVAERGFFLEDWLEERRYREHNYQRLHCGHAPACRRHATLRFRRIAQRLRVKLSRIEALLTQQHYIPSHPYQSR